MTKEELEKYTIDFMNNETGSNRSNINSFMGRTLIKYSEIFQKRIAELEKENAELRNRNQELLQSCEGATMMYKDLQKTNKQLTKAIELLKHWINSYGGMDIYLCNKSQNFIDEVEK